MQLITELRHPHLGDALAVGARLRIDIDNQQRVIEFAAGRLSAATNAYFSGGACIASLGDG
jgi:hypothetical protein